MAIPEQIINEIKYRNDIEEIISPYVALKRRGKNLVGLCPFHNEKTPSFTVYPENASFYCFGCGVGGDVVTFTRLIENLDYIEALRLLAERSGVALPENGYDDSFQKLKNTIYDINRESAKFFHSYLMSSGGKKALDYLTGRGLTIQTIRHFGLGAAPDSWDALRKHLLSKGFSEEDMYQANVIGKSDKGYYDRFRRRVIFPIINIRGNVIGFSGRAMPGDDNHGGKYVNTADTPVYKKSENLFGMNFAKNACSQRLILVEGNMDVISLQQAGFVNTVAALGTAFTSEQAKLISRYTKEIVLTMDADAAGQKAVRRAAEVLKNTGLDVRIVVIPDGKDPDEFIKKHGANRFSALLDGAVSELEYRLLGISKEIETESDDGKIQYLSRAAAILASTSDEIARDMYIGKLCDRFGVSRTALENRVGELRKQNAEKQYRKSINAVISPKYSKDDINPERRSSPRGTAAEEAVIAVLLRHPDYYKTARERLSPDDMLTSLNRRIYGRMLECEEQGSTPDVSSFGDMLSAAETGYIVALQNGEKGSDNACEVLNDSINVILREKELLFNTSSENSSVEDWAIRMEQIIKNKQKGN